MNAEDRAPTSSTPAPADERRTAVVVGALVVVLAVAAAGTGALRGFHSGVADGGDLGIRLLLGLLVGAGVGGLVVLGLRRLGAARLAAIGLAGGAAMVLVVVIVAAIGATAAVSTAPLHPEVPSANTIDEAPSTSAPRPPDDTLPGDEAGTSPLPSWVGTVLAILGLILVLFLLIGLSRTFALPKLRLRGGMQWGNRRAAELTLDELDVDAAADSFDDSAASIGDGVDPRAAIIAAYARLLDGLTEAGCGRQPFEAPEEHLRRSLLALGVQPEHMRVVVDKFLVARFSTHPLTSADADAVRAELREAGRQLRAVAPARDAAVAPS
jgi:hypothetical protein